MSAVHASTRSNSPTRCTLAPGVPGIRALGVEEAGDLLDRRVGLGTQELDPRAEDLGVVDGARVIRYPLPGTVDAGGKAVGLPRGAGTGWVLLRRFGSAPGGPPLLRRLKVRFSRPRSASLAEREWNLLCHLRAGGVGTPDLMVVGARGNGPLAPESFLVVRELTGMEPLGAWMERTMAAPREAGPESEQTEEHALGLEAIGRFLHALFRSGIVLPDLGPEDILVGGGPEKAVTAPGGT